MVDIPIESIPTQTHFASFSGLTKEHFAIIVGQIDNAHPLVRVHSECMTGDVFGSKRCDCGTQLTESLKSMDAAQAGILIYLRQEGRGIGLYAKFDAYALQQQGIDTFTANRMLGYGEDERDFSDAASMLRALDIKSIALITNNREKVASLQRNGINVISVIPSGVYLTPENERYLRSKAAHQNHMIDL
jgi:GTP cyclohydrolase II